MPDVSVVLPVKVLAPLNVHMPVPAMMARLCTPVPSEMIPLIKFPVLPFVLALLRVNVEGVALVMSPPKTSFDPRSARALLKV